MAESTLHPFAPHLTGRPAKDLPVNKLKVPAGFKVEVWADGIPEARSLALGDKGTVFVSNRNAKSVYAVIDKGGKREVKTLMSGLDAPNGVAFSKGTLYVAERGRITRYDGIETRLDKPGGTTPRPRSLASIRRLASSRRWRGACATRWAWTGTRRPRSCGSPTTRATG